MIKKCDVFIQNFRPGVAAKLQLDYGTLSKHNSRLIYATASGYGLKGPDSQQPSLDYMAQAGSGIMTAIGEPDLPPVSPLEGLAHHISSLMVAYGILAGLVARRRLGVGQELDISLLGSTTFIKGLPLTAYLLRGLTLPKLSRKEARNPIYNHYQCPDGSWLALGMWQSDRYWSDFCQAVGIGELTNDPRFENAERRQQNCELLVSTLDSLFATTTRTEWVEILRGRGDLIYSEVNEVADLATDPQMLANEYIIDFAHPNLGQVKLPGIPVKFHVPPQCFCPMDTPSIHDEYHPATNISRRNRRKAVTSLAQMFSR